MKKATNSAPPGLGQAGEVTENWTFQALREITSGLPRDTGLDEKYLHRSATVALISR
jgi:hypothetical protein